MLSSYLERGALAGAVGGVVYGLFLWFVGTPLVHLAERYEESASGGAGHAPAPAVPDAVASVTSVLGGVLFGLFLGAFVFGLGYYVLEPSIPGGSDTRSYLLGVAGFVTVSGAPWVVLPPRPPGVEAALSTDVRLGIYVGSMALGALACGLAWSAVRSLRGGDPASAVAIGLAAVVVVPVVGALVPTGVVRSPIPGTLATAFRWATVFGQVTLWLAMASSHAWLLRRSEGLAKTDVVAEGAMANDAVADDATVAAD